MLVILSPLAAGTSFDLTGESERERERERAPAAVHERQESRFEFHGNPLTAGSRRGNKDCGGSHGMLASNQAKRLRRRVCVLLFCCSAAMFSRVTRDKRKCILTSACTQTRMQSTARFAACAAASVELRLPLSLGVCVASIHLHSKM